MADHLDAPGLTSPMSDPRTDITDVYAVRKPGASSKSILVLNVNPLAPALASFFNSEGIYTINVDTDGDAIADRSFRIRFSEVEDGAQTATVHLAKGALAARLNDGGRAVIAGAPASFGSQPHITTRGEYRFFAGLRSDPFLAPVLRPDLLDYDFLKPSGYLNGRRLQDDVIDISLNLVTNGGLKTDGVGPHTDYLTDFPYLGQPH